MALPSQNARPIARRSHMVRSRRRRPGMLLGVVVVVVAVLVTWALWPDGGEGPGPAPDGPGPGDAAAAVTDRPTDDEMVVAQRPERTDTAPRTVITPPPPSEPAPAGRSERDMTAEPRSAPAAASPPPVSPPPAAPDLDTRTLARPATVDAPDRGAAGSPGRMSEARVSRLVRAGLERLDRNEPLEGRLILSRALRSGALPADEAAFVRDRLTTLNERLVFGPEIVPDDPFATVYTVRSGDALSRIPRRLGVQADWRLVQRVNGIRDPRRIREGQRLKLVTGPFHAVVSKQAFRMDVYLGEGEAQVYVRSFDVGLGEFDSTPEGRFRVRNHSKLVNPEWVNPRNGDRYLPDDPANPIGEYWLGLVGDEPHLAGVEGYGIHGTIEPDSIGRQASMGCIRLLPNDVAMVWEMLMENVSTVEIRR